MNLKNEVHYNKTHLPLFKRHHKHRHTFPCQVHHIDDKIDHHHHHHHHKKRKRSYPFAQLDDQYNEQYVYIKEYDSKNKTYKKEIIIKNCKKVYPVNENISENNDDPRDDHKQNDIECSDVVRFLSMKILKLLYCLGCITCAAI